MKFVLVLGVLACAVALVTSDLVCGSDYCKKQSCPAAPAQSSCKGGAQYRAKHAGKCACCPACVTILSEGQGCKKYSKELGETPSEVCAEKLTCIKGVCTKVAPRR